MWATVLWRPAGCPSISRNPSGVHQCGDGERLASRSYRPEEAVIMQLWWLHPGAVGFTVCEGWRSRDLNEPRRGQNSPKVIRVLGRFGCLRFSLRITPGPASAETTSKVAGRSCNCFQTCQRIFLKGEHLHRAAQPPITHTTLAFALSCATVGIHAPPSHGEGGADRAAQRSERRTTP